MSFGVYKIKLFSTINVRPKNPEPTLEDYANWFQKLDRVYSKPIIEPFRCVAADADKLLILPISDLHFNLLASNYESGNEYNCKIAESLYFKIISDIMERTKQYRFEKIIFTIGGDQANCDNINGSTTKGTLQNNQHGYFEMVEKLNELTIKAIDVLADIAPVDVLLINGNHDKTVSFGLAQNIKAWYRSDCRVTVDTSPLPRKYIKYGKTLFCLAHNGDTKKLPRLIADEARKYWSDVDNTEVFLQHLHSECVLVEDNHMRIQRLPTVSANSTWANDSGYNSKRQCKSFVFDKEYGLTDVLYTVIK